jgi:hypothetical protein
LVSHCHLTIHFFYLSSLGHDNGGFEGGNESIMFGEPENQKRTTDVLVYLAKNLTIVNATAGYEGSVQGLCLLNEPWTTTVGGPLSMQLVKDWSQEATDAVIAAGWKGDIWFPDGFDLLCTYIFVCRRWWWCVCWCVDVDDGLMLWSLFAFSYRDPSSSCSPTALPPPLLNVLPFQIT